LAIWYDERADKYRSSFPFKIFYGWSWRIIRWFIWNCMKPEQAHWFAIHLAIPVVGRIERCWQWLMAIPVLVLIGLLRLIALLPGFSWEPDPD
jgi:hypothetical protein